MRGLGFKPELKLSLKGSTKRGGTPAFKAVLHMPPSGDANIAQAQVTLPHSEFLDNAHIGTVCTRVQFAEGNVPGEKCPAASLYGHAKAISPILSEPLEGPVYLRSTGTGAGHHLLPDLVAALHNNQVNIALDGHVEGVHGGIRNTFEAGPRRPGHRIRPRNAGWLQGAFGKQHQPLRQAQPRKRRLHRPQRQGREIQPADGSEVPEGAQTP